MIDFILYSNLYVACGAAAIAYATTLTLGTSVTWEILFLPFANVFFVYTLNRYTDKNEDRINVPVRVQFFEQHGMYFLTASIISYCIALSIALARGILIFGLFIVPLCIGLLYSFSGLKKVVIAKNLSIGLAWGSIVLLTCAFCNNFSVQVLLLFAFFTIGVIVNTIIFDVKDIRGDKLHGIITLPVVLGVRRAQFICYALNGIALAIIVAGIATQLFPLSAIILCAFTAYIFAYTYLCNENRGRLYFGLFVDGELIFLLVGLLLYQVFS